MRAAFRSGGHALGTGVSPLLVSSEELTSPGRFIRATRLVHFLQGNVQATVEIRINGRVIFQSDMKVSTEGFKTYLPFLRFEALGRLELLIYDPSALTFAAALEGYYEPKPKLS